jgi:glutamate-1-semialdehyde aminotransferase
MAGQTPGDGDGIDDPVARLHGRTAASRRLAQTHGCLADGGSTLDQLPGLRDLGYPLVADTFRGARFRDVDGNEYIDYCMAHGAALFGHAPPFVANALTEQIARGFGVGLGLEASSAGEVAALIAELTGTERVALACTGSEAVMIALRLARTVTMRAGVAVFSGSYHGQYDGTLVVADPAAGLAGPSPYGVPAAPGVPRGAIGDVLVCTYGAAESPAVIERHADELGAVLIAPARIHPVEPCPSEIVRQLRCVTERAGIALVFDEMLTGFRLALGGARAYCGVAPDLAVYGKALGGGMPIAAIAGASRFLDAIDGGRSGEGASGASPLLTTFTLSTFAKHPLTLAAALAVLRRLQAEGPALQERLSEQTSALVARMNDCLKRAGVPLRFASCGSHFGPAAPFDAASFSARLLHLHLLEHGIFLQGLGGFLSTEHTADDHASLCVALAVSIESLRRSGHASAWRDPPEATV